MESTGSLVFALHGHMPWVLRHGRWPHGEHWLFEAMLEVWLPLLEGIDALAARGVPTPLTLGLTPVLLEQLRDPRAQEGFAGFVAERIERAQRDQAHEDPSIRNLAADHWEPLLRRRKAQYDALDRDLVGAFAALGQSGRLELLSGFATHGYAALTKHDRCIRAQLEVGLATSERHLGYRPSGVWLPECSFRPGGDWEGPVLGVRRPRAGVDRILEAAGVTHFFVDSHLVAGARSEGVWEQGHFRKVPWTCAETEVDRGWRSVLEPHRVDTWGGPGRIVAFARHPDASEQVWSADAGYPGDGRYLEFHKRNEADGLRYWGVTDRAAGLGEKALYDPEAASLAVRAHAEHFADMVRRLLGEGRAATGRQGCVTAPFDAELFGHWWAEGPAFVFAVLEALHHAPEVRVETAANRIARCPPQTVVWLPEGSWGEGGDHRVWLNDETRWTWESLYRMEDRFLGLRYRVDEGEEGGAEAKQIAEEAARELLLLQASDWQFVVSSGGAVDYGFRRFAVHLERLEALLTLLQDDLDGAPPDPVLALRRAEARAASPCFPGVDVQAWRER